MISLFESRLPETCCLELHDESAKDREDRLVATSLLSFGTKRHNSSGMAYRMEIVDDQIDVTSRAFLAITVSCAKCHDHKFDPIPTKDYYALGRHLPQHRSSVWHHQTEVQQQPNGPAPAWSQWRGFARRR